MNFIAKLVIRCANGFGDSNERANNRQLELEAQLSMQTRARDSSFDLFDTSRF